MITAYGYTSLGNERYLLAPDWTAEGQIVARTIDDILGGVIDWPGNAYELRVDPRDVLGQGPHVLRVRRYDVVRVVPRERIFGRNVAQLDAFIAELRATAWLRPSGEDRRPRAVALVAEHYAALGHYGSVRACRPRIVREPNQLEPLILDPIPLADRHALTSRGRAEHAVARAIDRRLSMPLKLALSRIVSGIVIPATWRAAWEHAAAAYLDLTLTPFLEEDEGLLLDDLSVGLIERTGRALDAGKEPGLSELLAMGPGDLDGPVEQAAIATAVASALAELAGDVGEEKQRFDASIAGIVERLWSWARHFSQRVTTQAGWHAFHMASGLREPNPWAPWMGLLRLGLWPLADDGVEMTVYDPQRVRD